MTPKSKPVALVNPKRFKTIQDLTRLRPDCGASIDDIFVIDNESLFIIDLSNIGSWFDPYSSPGATYVRSHGVVVGSYSFSESAPVLWRDPFLLISLSHHLMGNHNIYTDMANIVGSVSCPSGSFLLLPFRLDIPIPFNQRLDDAIAGETGVEINLPNGNYRVFYEQFETPEGD
jgi:hypothetical protein